MAMAIGTQVLSESLFTIDLLIDRLWGQGACLSGTGEGRGLDQKNYSAQAQQDRSCLYWSLCWSLLV